jgi:hypothetical protein
LGGLQILCELKYAYSLRFLIVVELLCSYLHLVLNYNLNLNDAFEASDNAICIRIVRRMS